MQPKSDLKATVCRISLVMSISVLLSSCVIGTTARDRVYPPLELTFSVSSKWFRSPAEGAAIEIHRYYPALLLGTYIPVVEGKTDAEGRFVADIHLRGTYTIYVGYEGHDGFYEHIENLSESRRFDLSLSRVESAENAFPRPEYWPRDDTN